MTLPDSSSPSHATDAQGDPVDYYALLDLPRHPWVDPVLLKERYHRAASQSHPDSQSGSNRLFIHLGEAVTCLRDPAARLRHLVAIEYPPASVKVQKRIPDPALFAKVSEAIQAASSARSKRKCASSSLARAAAKKECLASAATLKKRIEEIKKSFADLDAECRDVGDRWREQEAGFWLGIASLYKFLSKWDKELRNKLFDLENE